MNSLWTLRVSRELVSCSFSKSSVSLSSLLVAGRLVKFAANVLLLDSSSSPPLTPLSLPYPPSSFISSFLHHPFLFPFPSLHPPPAPSFTHLPCSSLLSLYSLLLHSPSSVLPPPPLTSLSFLFPFCFTHLLLPPPPSSSLFPFLQRQHRPRVKERSTVRWRRFW